MPKKISQTSGQRVFISSSLLLSLISRVPLPSLISLEQAGAGGPSGGALGARRPWPAETLAGSATAVEIRAGMAWQRRQKPRRPVRPGCGDEDARGHGQLRRWRRAAEMEAPRRTPAGLLSLPSSASSAPAWPPRDAGGRGGRRPARARHRRLPMARGWREGAFPGGRRRAGVRGLFFSKFFYYGSCILVKFVTNS